eukprot:351933-Chlamydomonas_euryale.AAC.3
MWGAIYPLAGGGAAVVALVGRGCQLLHHIAPSPHHHHHHEERLAVGACHPTTFCSPPPQGRPTITH